MITIDVAKDFSRTPFGRYRKDGDYSAERFRVEFLKPELEKGEYILVDFSKVALGVGSSFLEEAFGGLVREGFSKEMIMERIKIVAKMSFYAEQVKRFVEIA